MPCWICGRWRRPSSGSTSARRCCWTTKKTHLRPRRHFGGGPGYCASCVALDRPWAHGKPGADGHRCPYFEHEPLTDAGWQAWDVVIRCSGQLRLAPNAAIVIGIDLAAALAIGTALGRDLHALAELLPAAEAGMLNVINRRLVSAD